MPHHSEGPNSAVESLIRLCKTINTRGLLSNGLLPKHKARIDEAFRMMHRGVDEAKSRRYRTRMQGYVDALQIAQNNIGNVAAALVAARGPTAILALRYEDRVEAIQMLRDRRDDIESELLQDLSEKYMEKYGVAEVKERHSQRNFFYAVDLASFLNEYEEPYAKFDFNTGMNDQLPSIQLSREDLQDLLIHAMERNKERLHCSLPAP